ncbi:MAG TPA: hypothetical protein VL400_09995 [Polyangiaceae bacterium]|nr:hypothetical protein [Polyangiaceae bacterium]
MVSSRRAARSLVGPLGFVGFWGLVGSLAALAACGGNVVIADGESGGGGNGRGDGGSSVVTTPAQPAATTSSSDTTSGPTVGPAFIYPSGPDELTFRLTTFGASCSAPALEAPFNQCDWADLRITFPSSAFTPGTTLDSSFFAAQCTISESGKADASGTCESGTGGGNLFGSLRFDSIDGSTTTVTLSGWADFFIDHEVDGTIVAENCSTGF